MQSLLISINLFPLCMVCTYIHTNMCTYMHIVFYYRVIHTNCSNFHYGSETWLWNTLYVTGTTITEGDIFKRTILRKKERRHGFDQEKSKIQENRKKTRFRSRKKVIFKKKRKKTRSLPRSRKKVFRSYFFLSLISHLRVFKIIALHIYLNIPGTS